MPPKVKKMSKAEILSTLKKAGKANTAKIYARHGVTGPCWGVPYADLDKLAKRVGQNYNLASELWDTGVHDARVLATKVVKPEMMSRSQADSWIRGSDNYILTDAVSGPVGNSAQGVKIATAWTHSDNEWIAAAGWNIYCMAVLDKKLDEMTAKGLISKIQHNIRRAQNRTRYSMNNCLIAIGGKYDTLRQDALKAARAIGKVEVDHGKTGCKTPDAVKMIQKMIARKKGKKSPKKKASR